MTLSSSLRNVSLLFWFAVRSATAQPHEAAFGEVRRFGIPGATSRLTPLTSWIAGTSVVMSFSPKEQRLQTAVVDTLWSVREVRSFVVPQPFDDIQALPSLRQDAPRVILIDDRTQAISIAVVPNGETLKIVQTVKLPFIPDHVTATDVTNDGITDLLVFNRATPGIIPVIGRPNGTFSVRKEEAPDDFVGELLVTHLNEDGVQDIVVYEWVKSEIHLWYGVGGGRFIDQGFYPVAGTVDSILSVRTKRRTSGEFLLRFSDPPGYEYWRGNAFGEFHHGERTTHASAGRTSATLRLDPNSPDQLLSIDASGNAVLFVHDGRDAFQEEMAFALPSATSAAARVKMPDGSTDVAISFTDSDTFWVLSSSKGVRADAAGVSLVCGRTPSNVVIVPSGKGPVSGVFTSSAPDSSVYWHQYDPGRAVRPMQYSFQFRPSSLVVSDVTESGASVLVGSKDDRTVASVALGFADRSVSGSVISTEGIPILPEAAARSARSRGFSVLNASTTDGRLSLSFYQQVGLDRFVEQNFRLTAPIELLGTAVTDRDSDGNEDIIYAFRESDSSSTGIAIAYGDSAQTMKRRTRVMDLPVTEVQQTFLWNVDLVGDSSAEIVGYLDGNVSGLWIVADGDSSGSRREFLMLPEVKVRERDDVRFADVDADGRKEVIFCERDTRRLVIAALSSDSVVHLSYPLGDEQVAAFDVGDLNGDAVPEIAYVTHAPDLLHIRTPEVFVRPREGER